MIHLDLTSGTPPSPKSNARSLTRFPAGSCRWEKNSPIRTLAQELGLAVNTVARSYRALEDEGYVVTQGRAGTRVSARAVSKEVALAHHAKAYVAIAREAGASDDEALDAIRAFLKDMP